MLETGANTKRLTASPGTSLSPLQDLLWSVRKHTPCVEYPHFKGSLSVENPSRPVHNAHLHVWAPMFQKYKLLVSEDFEIDVNDSFHQKRIFLSPFFQHEWK